MRKISILFVLLLLAMPSVASADVLAGDVNGDGETGIADVTELIDMLLKGHPSAVDYPAADVNADGDVSIADVMELIDILLHEGDDPNCPWVDLGLPSRTLWAKWNVGASCPEEYGDYFSWGETTPKDSYSLYNYKWALHPGDYQYVTKYCLNSQYGTVDNKSELDPEDDAATANWGPQWRMPTPEEMQELLTYCRPWQWTTLNGVVGKLGTGPNGNTIFLPAGGCHFASPTNDGVDSLYYEGEQGIYWSNTVNGGAYAYYMVLYRQFEREYESRLRAYGCNVRAVRE